MNTSPLYVLKGSIIHSLNFGSLEVIEDGAIVYDGFGTIKELIDCSRQSIDIYQKYLSADITDYTGKLIIPGFVDAHCHAPQYAFAGTGMDLPLLEWLQKYTFPIESKFSDNDIAENVYRKSIRRHLKNGTTLASYFATIHNEAAKILVDIITEAGQRAFVGKVSMDRHAPDYYLEDTDTAILEAEDFVRHVLSLTEIGKAFVKEIDGSDPASLFDRRPRLKAFPRVMPCVTPRFVPTCTEKLMKGLGRISLKYGVPVQSHLSETPAEIEWVKSLHPEATCYGAVYADCNLLHADTYMAHCCHCNAEERKLLKETDTGVVHCPLSNAMLQSGTMDVRLFKEEGFKVGLGTDVAGGYSPSMLDAIRSAIISSNNLAVSKNAERPGSYTALSYKEAFYLATQGSADVLGLGSTVGNFAAGKTLDCLIIDPSAEGGPIDIFEGETAIDKFQKYIFLGDDRNVEAIFVDGMRVIVD